MTDAALKATESRLRQRTPARPHHSSARPLPSALSFSQSFRASVNPSPFHPAA